MIYLYDSIQMSSLQLPDVESAVCGLDEHEVMRRSPLDSLHWEQMTACYQHSPPFAQRNQVHAVVRTHTHYTLLETKHTQ